MDFFVVDDEEPDLSLAKDLLHAVYPDATIKPEPDRTYSKWAKAWSAIRSNTDDAPSQVILLDLAIESKDRANVASGISQSSSLRALRPLAVFVAYTNFGTMARVEARFQQIFDGLLDKQRLESYDDRDEQKAYVRRIIDSAVRKRTGSPERDLENVVLEDSLGLRLFRAAFGDDVFPELVQAIAEDGDDVRIRALTSGHSGAFILAMSWQGETGQQRVVIKVARDEKVIGAETTACRKYLSRLGPIGGVLAVVDAQPRNLQTCTGVYYLQAHVHGQPLLRELQENDWTERARRYLDGIVSLELSCYQLARETQYGKLKPRERFPLTLVDRGRAQVSIGFLHKLGRVLSDRGQWPSGIEDPEAMGTSVLDVVTRWDQHMEDEDDLLCVAQHGDLNPGNVMVTAPGNVVLIDLARLGMWPVGYDLCRLATMLRLRLTDHESGQDWVVNGLDRWCQERFCQIGNGGEVGSSLSPQALFCDQQFDDFVRSGSAEERAVLVRGYLLGAFWDLTKVLSYEDLSPFKRIWAMVAHWRLGRRLGYVRE